jgi:2-oxo-3-hexenedioate decarboxylase
MSTPDLAAIARDIAAAQDAAGPLVPLTSRHAGFDLAAAYEVARHIHLQRLAEGAVLAGRKIGFTNPEMWELYGVRQPVWGHVHDRTLIDAGSGHAVCRIGRFVSPKIEPEIVVHLKARPPAGADAAALLACIDWIAVGLEIVQCHYPDWKFAAPDTVADSSLHACLLVGPRQGTEALGPGLASALERFSLTLACDGQVREQGQGSNVLGSPLRALSHLIEVLAGQPGAPGLEAGELVTTGTITKALPIRAGEVWSASVEAIGLEGLSVAFEA